MRRLTAALLSVVMTVTSGVLPAFSQGGGPLPLIRDAEIEHILASYATPVIQGAGLDVGAVRIHIVNDDTLNAFVANGQRIFVNTGLILATETPGQLVGVLAHETGHIRGGHLIATRDAISRAQTYSLVATLLGLAAVVAGASSGGNTQAGTAALLGGQAVGQQSFLQYSQLQESAADQTGAILMEKAGWSPRGLVEFLEILGRNEGALISSSDRFNRTHPLSEDRIARLKSRVEHSNLRDQKAPAEVTFAHRMMQAKIFGFIKKPDVTLRQYPVRDTSAPARYARAVAYHKQALTDKAIAEMDSLIAEQPDNAYFHELKGQILLESSRVDPAVVSLNRANDLLPHPTISALLARALVATGKPEDQQRAGSLLKAVVQLEPDHIGAWRTLSRIFGAAGNHGMASLTSAEAYFHAGQLPFALEQASRALRVLPQNSPAYYRASDIRNAVLNQTRPGETLSPGQGGDRR